MGLFEHWPYVNFHELNTNWLIGKVKNIETAEANTAASAEAAAESAAASQQSADASQQSADASQQSAEDSASSASQFRNKLDQIDLNTARINNILVQGTPTEGNAELIDIRVGADGTTYPTAGDAVRSQIRTAENEILETLNYVGGNILTMFGYEYSGMYLNEEGLPTTGNAWSITEKIPVSNLNVYAYSGITYIQNTARCFYYDANDTIIGAAFYLTTAGGELTPPENAVYARFTVCRTTGDINTFSLRKKYDNLSEQIEILQNDAVNIPNGIYSKNMYDASGNMNGYINTAGVIVPGNAWRITDFIPVVPKYQYSYNGITYTETQVRCFFYDKKKNVIVSTAFVPELNKQGLLTVPEDAYYVRFTLNNQMGDVNTFTIRMYLPSGMPENVITVGKDGSQMFSTINEAYAYAYTIQSAENPVTILIYPGTYNEVLECTSANSSPYRWGAYVSFIGVNKKDVIWRNDTGLYANAPLHTSNPGLIKNITFIATHDDNAAFETTYAGATSQNYGAYALHLDDPTNASELTGSEYETIVEDCILISNQHAAAGIGMRAGQTLIMRNCRMIMTIPEALKTAADSLKGSLLYHRIIGTTQDYIQHLIIDNCSIETNMDKAIFTYGSGGGFKVDFLRNFIWSDTLGSSNDVIRGPVGMVTNKSYGNNVILLNKTVI